MTFKEKILVQALDKNYFWQDLVEESAWSCKNAYQKFFEKSNFLNLRSCEELFSLS